MFHNRFRGLIFVIALFLGGTPSLSSDEPRELFRSRDFLAIPSTGRWFAGGESIHRAFWPESLPLAEITAIENFFREDSPVSLTPREREKMAEILHSRRVEISPAIGEILLIRKEIGLAFQGWCNYRYALSLVVRYQDIRRELAERLIPTLQRFMDRDFDFAGSGGANSLFRSLDFQMGILRQEGEGLREALIETLTFLYDLLGLFRVKRQRENSLAVTFYKTTERGLVELLATLRATPFLPPFPTAENLVEGHFQGHNSDLVRFIGELKHLPPSFGLGVTTEGRFPPLVGPGQRVKNTLGEGLVEAQDQLFTQMAMVESQYEKWGGVVAIFWQRATHFSDHVLARFRDDSDGAKFPLAGPFAR